MDGAVQLTRAVLGAGAFLQQKASTLRADVNVEALVSETTIHMFLKICDLLVENQSECFRIERVIRDDGIDSIHEFR